MAKYETQFTIEGIRKRMENTNSPDKVVADIMRENEKEVALLIEQGNSLAERIVAQGEETETEKMKQALFDAESKIEKVLKAHEANLHSLVRKALLHKSDSRRFRDDAGNIYEELFRFKNFLRKNFETITTKHDSKSSEDAGLELEETENSGIIEPEIKIEDTSGHEIIERGSVVNESEDTGHNINIGSQEQDMSHPETGGEEPAEVSYKRADNPDEAVDEADEEGYKAVLGALLEESIEREIRLRKGEDKQPDVTTEQWFRNELESTYGITDTEMIDKAVLEMRKGLSLIEDAGLDGFDQGEPQDDSDGGPEKDGGETDTGEPDMESSGPESDETERKRRLAIDHVIGKISDEFELGLITTHEKAVEMLRIVLGEYLKRAPDKDTLIEEAGRELDRRIKEIISARGGGPAPEPGEPSSPPDKDAAEVATGEDEALGTPGGDKIEDTYKETAEAADAYLDDKLRSAEEFVGTMNSIPENELQHYVKILGVLVNSLKRDFDASLTASEKETYKKLNAEDAEAFRAKYISVISYKLAAAISAIKSIRSGGGTGPDAAGPDNPDASAEPAGPDSPDEPAGPEAGPEDDAEEHKNQLLKRHAQRCAVLHAESMSMGAESLSTRINVLTAAIAAMEANFLLYLAESHDELDKEMLDLCNRLGDGQANFKEEYVKHMRYLLGYYGEQLGYRQSGGAKENVDILDKLGIKVSAESFKDDLECDFEEDVLKLKAEARKTIDEIVVAKNIGANEDERKIIADSIELSLNAALDLEAAREFSKIWKYHKKTVAAVAGAGAIAAVMSAGLRTLGGNFFLNGMEAGSGFLTGAAGGAFSGKVRGWFNPAIDRLKAKNAAELEKVKKEKASTWMTQEMVKIIASQEIRRAALEKFTGSGISSIEGYKKNAREALDAEGTLRGVDEETKEKMAEAIAVLAEISDEGNKRMATIARKKSSWIDPEAARGAKVGAMVGAATDFARYFSGNNPFASTIAGAAISGVMYGKAIDAGTEKMVKRRREAAVVRRVEEIGIDLEAQDTELEEDEKNGRLAELKAYLEEGALKEYPHAEAQAKEILMNALIGGAGSLDRVAVADERKAHRVKMAKWERARKIASYGIGLGAGIAAGYAGRMIIDRARGAWTGQPGGPEGKGGSVGIEGKGGGKGPESGGEVEELTGKEAAKQEKNYQTIKEFLERTKAEAAESGAKKQGPDVPPEAKAATEATSAKEKARIEMGLTRRGGGVEHSLRRQLEADPKEFGFDGDPKDAKAVRKWSGVKAHQIATGETYRDPETGQMRRIVDPQTGRETRIKGAGIGHASYVLTNKGGQSVVELYVDGKKAGGQAGKAFEYDYGGRKAKGTSGAKPFGMSVEDQAGNKNQTAPKLAGSEPLSGGAKAEAQPISGNKPETSEPVLDRSKGEHFPKSAAKPIDEIVDQKAKPDSGRGGAQAFEAVGKKPVAINKYEPELTGEELKQAIIESGFAIETVRKAGIGAGSPDFTPEDFAKIKFWSSHQDLLPANDPARAKQFFELSAGMDNGESHYARPGFARAFEAYSELPESFKADRKLSINYLKIFSISSPADRPIRHEGLIDLLGTEDIKSFATRGGNIEVKLKNGENLPLNEKWIGSEQMQWTKENINMIRKGIANSGRSGLDSVVRFPKEW